MAQTSILGRIGQLVRANINALLDSAEDPEKMLDQLVRDFTNNIAEAEEAVAQTIGNLRLSRTTPARPARRPPSGAARPRPRRAGPTQLRAAGNTAEADRFDNLAKIALRRQISFEEQAKTLETQAAQQTELADKLKDGLNKLRAQARGARPEARRARQPRQDGPGAGPGPADDEERLGHGSDLASSHRFEERVRRQEAQVARHGGGRRVVARRPVRLARVRRGRARGRGAPRGAQDAGAAERRARLPSGAAPDDRAIRTARGPARAGGWASMGPR